MTIDEVDLTLSSFWIQLHGLPMASMNRHILSDIGSSIGQLLELESLPNGFLASTFFVLRSALIFAIRLRMIFYSLALICQQHSFAFAMRNYQISVTDVVALDILYQCVLMKFQLVQFRNMVLGYVLIHGIVRLSFLLLNPTKLYFIFLDDLVLMLDDLVL